MAQGDHDSAIVRRTMRTLIAETKVRAMNTRYTRVATMRPFSNIFDSCRSGPIRNIVLQHRQALMVPYRMLWCRAWTMVMSNASQFGIEPALVHSTLLL